MKLFRKTFLVLALPFTTLFSGCSLLQDPRVAYLAVDIATEIGVFLVQKIDDGTLWKMAENFLDSLFGDVSDTLSDVTKGAIIEDKNDPSGLTGRKLSNVDLVVKTHRNKDFKTETILVKKEDLIFYRTSRDSTSKWELSDVSKTKIKDRLNTAAIQISLKSFDINPGRVDGIWGDRTGKAIKEFQSKNGLPETGEADENTLKLLLRG